MARMGRLNKDLLVTDNWWLDKDLLKGKVVYVYSSYTYGCVSRDGIAVTDEPDTEPFYEVPADSVDWQ